MNVQAHIQLTSDIWQFNERFRSKRIRSMGRDSDARDSLLTHGTNLLHQSRHSSSLPILIIPIHHFPVSNAMQALRSESSHSLRVSDDISSGSRTVFHQLASAIESRITPNRARLVLQLLINDVETVRPAAEICVMAFAHLTHIRVLQMSMRIH